MAAARRPAPAPPPARGPRALHTGAGLPYAHWYTALAGAPATPGTASGGAPRGDGPRLGRSGAAAAFPLRPPERHSTRAVLARKLGRGCVPCPTTLCRRVTRTHANTHIRSFSSWSRARRQRIVSLSGVGRWALSHPLGGHNTPFSGGWSVAPAPCGVARGCAGDRLWPAGLDISPHMYSLPLRLDAAFDDILFVL